MIDVNSLTTGDEIQVLGIVGYSNTTTGIPGWINSNELIFKFVTYDKNTNLIQMRSESYEPDFIFIVSPSQITKVIAPRPKVYILYGFGDTKFFKFEEVKNWFKFKCNEDINLSDFKNIIDNQDGTRYVLELEVNSKFYKKLFDNHKIGDKVKK